MTDEYKTVGIYTILKYRHKDADWYALYENQNFIARFTSYQLAVERYKEMKAKNDTKTNTK